MLLGLNLLKLLKENRVAEFFTEYELIPAGEHGRASREVSLGLCFTVLCCVVLRCVALCCGVVWCVVVCCVVVWCVVLWSAVLSCAVLCSPVLCCAVL